ncbi:LOW QUALITY PROTEIN: hypothetical protein U9M48_002474 [Paspalum notatum var. saurae]|uniref:EGF-like domain-containing protein n=1 Tax=Paspalum notatum var. saurae TaxID=547442 RepID=A0AAQ3PJI2_PASNO
MPLVLLVAVARLLVLRLAAHTAPVGLLGCNTTCGGVEVPYPFGIGANCSLPGFNLTCDHAHDPPWLLLSYGAGSTVPKLHVRKIHLGNGTVYVTANGGTILNHTSNPANHSHAGVLGGGGRDDGERRPGPFVLSCHHNKFVVLGCNLQASLFGDDYRLLTGCSSFCTLDYLDDSKQQRRWEVVWEPTEGHHCGRCSGNGCCQAKIPLYYPMYDVKLQRLDGHHHHDNVDQVMQNLVLIAQDGWIEKVWCWMVQGADVSHLRGRKPPDLSKIPMVLQFLMNLTYPRKRGKADNTTSCPTMDADSNCKSSYSECIDVNNPFSNGYMCQCVPGYQGNPYLLDGCQDINECEHPDLYPCYGVCTNLPGTYECQCPRVSHGNYSMMHGCVKSSTVL